jgi:hypothetical protein
MRLCLTLATVFCTLFLFSPAACSSAEPIQDSRQALALWLSQQIHQPVAASQVLVAPPVSRFDGCSISRARTTLIGTTALSLRCPALRLPQLALLNFPFVVTTRPAASATAIWRGATHKGTLVVRAGAFLNADWRTDSMHAQLPVVALGSGAAGAEIRVRIAHTNRILRARISSAHSAIIVAPALDSERPI